MAAGAMFARHAFLLTVHINLAQRAATGVFVVVSTVANITGNIWIIVLFGHGEIPLS